MLSLSQNPLNIKQLKPKITVPPYFRKKFAFASVPFHFSTGCSLSQFFSKLRTSSGTEIKQGTLILKSHVRLFYDPLSRLPAFRIILLYSLSTWIVVRLNVLESSSLYMLPSDMELAENLPRRVFWDQIRHGK